jgi:hypothetical protein
MMLVILRALKIKAKSPYERHEGICGSGFTQLHSLLISVIGDNKWSVPRIGKRAPGNIEWGREWALGPDCKLEEENLLPPIGNTLLLLCHQSIEYTVKFLPLNAVKVFKGSGSDFHSV